MNIQLIRQRVLVLPNGCWEWQRSTSSAGYGQLTVDKKYWSAHRYAFSCFNALTPEEVVRHLCHNTKCCNPDHLLKGSHKDNYNDSREAHLFSAKYRRKAWSVNGIAYSTHREVVKLTGLSSTTVSKYMKDGVFYTAAYREGCKIAGWKPKV